MRPTLLLMVLPTIFLAGCGAGEAATATGAARATTAAPATSTAPATRTAPTPTATPVVYEVDASVIDSPEHGPLLCNFVLDSLPPQCGGPKVPVVGWDWMNVEGEESRRGTTWGEYHVTGSWDGTRLTLTTSPEPMRRPTSEVDPADTFNSPCPTPAGGWRVVNPATTTEARMISAMDRARKTTGFAGAWLDQSINPALADGDDPGDMDVANDPTKLVLNIRTAGNIAALERSLRRVWGGALCVSPAARTHAELESIQRELGRDGAIATGIRIELNIVEATLLVADPAAQDRYDSRYGEGAVRIDGWLQPVAR